MNVDGPGRCATVAGKFSKHVGCDVDFCVGCWASGGQGSRLEAWSFGLTVSQKGAMNAICGGRICEIYGERKMEALCGSVRSATNFITHPFSGLNIDNTVLPPFAVQCRAVAECILQ